MEIVAFLLSGIVVAALGNVGLGWLWAKIHVARLRQRSKGKLVLTYDDGPGERLEPRILEALARYDARATFYVVGMRIVPRRERLDALGEAGQELACHGHDHVHAWKALPWRVAKDIQRGFESLGKWATLRTSFRPPHGKLTLAGGIQLWWRGTPLSKWTHDTRDTRSASSRPSVEDFVARFRKDGGGVVLLHSFDREHTQEREDYVVEITEALLEAAREDGLEVVPFSELAD